MEGHFRSIPVQGSQSTKAFGAGHKMKEAFLLIRKRVVRAACGFPSDVQTNESGAERLHKSAQVQTKTSDRVKAQN
ncbi:MAG: hypothetical protein CBC48_16385 [bacterium TMED88]|nr:hypothetical protein [Deltaproteobacteria bacterium]OUV25496.1 MAG: hypothetical protein CBC48_16385 [bacterium TMED88]